MRQLGQLHRNADKFEERGAEIIAVFREEKSGVDGLKKIKDRTKVNFTLGLDTGATKTSAYSPGKMKFFNYVVDQQGIVRGVIDGTLKSRAQSDQLITILDSIKDSSPATPVDEAESVKRAVLDYVEGIYEVKPELIERGVHPNLAKFGFSRADGETEFKAGSAMTFEQLKKLAATYNKNGRIAKNAPKEVSVIDVKDKIASANLNAAWGTDMMHLVKENGKWKILQVVWQSPPKE